jgi:hypothetical protein
MHVSVLELSSIIYKLKCILSLYSDFKVKFIKRQANMIAHIIVRGAISWSSRYLFELIPPCIEQLLYNNKMMWVSSCQKKK